MKTLTAFYDLGVGPVSYDVIPFLIQARMAAEDAGCERVHVVIVPDKRGVDGMFKDKRHLYSAEEMHWRLWNLVIPACNLIRASVTLATDWDHARRLAAGDVWPHDWDRQTPANRHHLQREIIQAAKAGRKIPMLRASDHARAAVRAQVERAGQPLVTITLRNTYEPGRNSDVLLWSDLHQALRYQYHVEVLQDTSAALPRGWGFGELVLDLRMALYECAAMNFHPHGGPVVLCWFSGAPFAMFDAARPHKDWRQHWERNVGLQLGEQLPWASEDQRLIYDETTEQRVADEVTAWQARMAAR